MDTHALEDIAHTLLDDGWGLLDGRSFVQMMNDNGVLPGIKVDTGAKVLAGHPDETGSPKGSTCCANVWPNIEYRSVTGVRRSRRRRPEGWRP